MSGSSREKGRRLLSQSQVYYFIIGVSVLCAIAVFVLAVHFDSKEDAARGGAVPVLVSFLLLFLRRNYGEGVNKSVSQAYPKISEKIKAYSEGGEIVPFTPEETSEVILGILSRMNVEAQEQKNQNIALFVSSVFGTILLAFGDFFYILIHH